MRILTLLLLAIVNIFTLNSCFSGDLFPEDYKGKTIQIPKNYLGNAYFKLSSYLQEEANNGIYAKKAFLNLIHANSTQVRPATSHSTFTGAGNFAFGQQQIRPGATYLNTYLIRVLFSSPSEKYTLKEFQNLLKTHCFEFKIIEENIQENSPNVRIIKLTHSETLVLTKLAECKNTVKFKDVLADLKNRSDYDYDA